MLDAYNSVYIICIYKKYTAFIINKNDGIMGELYYHINY